MSRIEEIEAKLERHEPLTAYESGYQMGYTTAMADLIARQLEHVLEEGER